MEVIRGGKDELLGRVLEYIKAHGEELETDEALAQWWLGLQALDPSLDNITVALEELEKSGKIMMVDCGEDLFVYHAC